MAVGLAIACRPPVAAPGLTSDRSGDADVVDAESSLPPPQAASMPAARMLKMSSFRMCWLRVEDEAGQRKRKTIGQLMIKALEPNALPPSPVSQPLRT